jgi:hypothetical protein
VVAYYRLVFTAPALATGLTQFIASDQRALAVALGNNLRAEVTAACVIAFQQVLSRRN